MDGRCSGCRLFCGLRRLTVPDFLVQLAERVVDVKRGSHTFVEDTLKGSTVVKHTLKDDRTTGVIHKEVGSDRHLVKNFAKTTLLTILHTLEEVGLTLFVPVESVGHVVNPGLLLLLKFLFLLLTLCFFFGTLAFFFGTGSVGLFLFSVVALLYQVVNVFVVGLEVFTGLRGGLRSG